ncbi:MAG: CoA ester lyase [Pseudomonadales bacterium]|nr:CoA ester lyase [Pseudomonadales bacterium]MCP5348240.1 CoA ester lyase [Pseudomonadales bacterium]
MFKKALELPADALILDLEDSVPAAAKDAARTQVCDWLQEADFAGREKLVRINSLASDLGRMDLEAIMQCPPDAIVVPKVSSLGDVEAVDRLLIAREMQQGLDPESVRLLVLCTEEPAAVFNLSGMLQHPRVGAAAWAAEDLAAALGARSQRDADGNYLEVFQVTRSLCLLAAVAAGVQPIDGPYVNFRDTEGLQRECSLTASMGYSGKLTIHPDQIETVNAAFTPSDDEVRRAGELVQAFESAGEEGRLAFSFEGAMVDLPHLKKARAIVERARLIREKTG